MLFIQLYLFADTGNTVFLSAAWTVYVVAVQDHWLTDQVRGHRKSFVLFKPCKSRGLASHILPTHFFSQRILTPQSHSNNVGKDQSLCISIHNNRQEQNIIWLLKFVQPSSQDLIYVSFSSDLKENGFTVFGCLLVHRQSLLPQNGAHCCPYLCCLI